jgi:hypothetical protein
MRCCSCSYECIVGAATGYGTLGQLQNKGLVASGIQTEERRDETQSEKIARYRTWTTVWRRESSQH